jgi:hypothetical protein
MLRHFGIPLEMPITGCTLSIEKAPNSVIKKTPLRPYISKINIKARSSSEAKAFQAILSLARTALLQGGIRPGEAGDFFANLFLANPPEVKDSRIVITGAAMSKSNITRLASFLFAAPRYND